MVYQYSWKGMVQPVSAEKVALHLQKLEKKNGEVTKQAFVDSARSERSPMHKLFNWNDEEAAEKYRLYQARNIINSLVVTVIENDEETISTKVFVNPGSSEHTKGSYINIRKAMNSEDTRNQVLEDARREARWFMDKYKNLQEVADVISSIEDFLEKTA